MPLLVLVFARGTGLMLLHNGVWFALFLGAGLIGQDYSSGTLQLLFARPVTRSQYAVSRWLAAALGASCLVVIRLAIGVALLSIHGEAPTAKELALFGGQEVLSVFGTTSVLLLFSALLPGIGDLIALILLGFAGGGLQLSAALLKAPWLARAGEEIGRFAGPTLELGRIFSGGPVSFFEVASYFSTVTLCLALTIVILNWRELSYATD
jgi:ABC-type transport system involved in multi-copper enzyme maturation permease subunit